MLRGFHAGVIKYSAIGVVIAFALMCAIVIMTDFFFNDSITDVKYLKETYPDIPALETIPKAQARDRKEAKTNEKQ